MLYRKKMTDATRYLANTGASDFNNLFGQYLCLLKSALKWSPALSGFFSRQTWRGASRA